MKQLCSQCEKQPAKHFIRKTWLKTDRRHDLCLRCRRGQVDAERAR
jgi:hypothetical protein